MEKADRILEDVLFEFSNLAKIPRPSGHEKAISDFLKKYLTDAGFQVSQDEVYNLIVDKPATKGKENAPRIILQSHMDMVCVAEKGYDYHPLEDAIQLVRTEEYLSADRTSLGADDGIGVAESIYLLKNCREHGPLRAIITVDEEQGMTGAVHLDKKYLMDAEYLINCDSEDYDVLTVGSAGNVTIDFSREIQKVPSKCKNAYKLIVDGLKGGHSGERIGDGRANAIRVLAQTLMEISENGILEVAALDGGKARNAIPSSAEALIQTDLSKEAMENILEKQSEKCAIVFDGIDEVAFHLTPAEKSEMVFSEELMKRTLQLLLIIHTGVYAMSQMADGLVETSANIGVVSTDDEKLLILLLPRSAVDQKVDEFCQMTKILGELTGFQVSIANKSPGWKENRNSKLAELMAKIFEEQNGKKMKVETIHAGLECGWHFKKNPKLDIVSVGVTTEEIHSPRERMKLSTVTPQVKLIMETIKRLSICD